MAFQGQVMKNGINTSNCPKKLLIIISESHEDKNTGFIQLINSVKYVSLDFLDREKFVYKIKSNLTDTTVFCDIIITYMAITQE